MINVIVPTFNRPDGLKRAVRSVFAQTFASNGIKLIVVDNTPAATASAVIAELKRDCPTSIEMIALHEPAAGVANARNTAMTAIDADLVAFLDDDQSAPETWLEELLSAYKKTPAAVTFGPVETALPDDQLHHRTYFRAFFGRTPDLESGLIDSSFGCGNALVDFSQISSDAPWFDTRMNESGGEDDLLFERVRESGGDFAWAASAKVYEHPPKGRVTLAYTLKRAFAYGQSPITMLLKTSSRRFDKIAFWMLVGAGKATWHGLQWLGLSIVGHAARATQLDLAMRGLGKMFWWVDLRFYGAAALKSDAVEPVRDSRPLEQAEIEPV